MSVLDQFRDAEQRVVQRLKELEPMVAEYRELEQIAQRLGLDAAQDTTARAQTAPSSSRERAPRKPAGAASNGRKPAPPATGARRGRRRALPRGEREQQLLELVRERPGVTVAEAGKTMGVDPTALYRVVRRLEQSGAMHKNGRRLEPADGKPAG